MDFSTYFEPFDPGVFPSFHPVQNTIGEKTFFVSTLADILIQNIKVAVIGVGEGRNAIGNNGCSDAPDHVRKELFALYPDESMPLLADLGNIVGNTPEEIYHRLHETLVVLMRNDIFPIIIGGGNELAYIQYAAYREMEQMVSVVSVDAAFDFGHLNSPFNSQSFTERIITEEPSILYNYANIGYQSYFTDPVIVQMFEKLHFDLHRLGFVRGNIDLLEPVIRNADLMYFDINAIKYADAPGNLNASPNGLSADEACKLLKYAGYNDKLTSLGVYECNPRVDKNGNTAKLVAQMLWCFIEAYFTRKGDYPIGDVSTYQKFNVHLEELEQPMVFYKSDKTERWWMESPRTLAKKYFKQKLIPCNASDYTLASNGKVPDCWWNYQLKP